MKYQEWGAGSDRMTLNRAFEYTDINLRQKFTGPDNNPNLAELTRLPCLFMVEGREDEIAHVGRIIRARIVGNEIALEYTFDTDAPPLLNRQIYANKTDFDMPDDFEFSRGHWAVKDIDIYQMLVRFGRSGRQLPTVFTIPDHEQIEHDLVSVMMPFDAAFNPIYQTIRQAAQATGSRCLRADDMWEADAIIQDIVSLIDRSRVIVCDCTGRNPNVFYEAGIAHTLGREVILITQVHGDIPFDLRHLRYIHYLNNEEGRTALATALSARLQTLLNR